jgi:large subunit ribosomal protein L13
MLKTHVTKPADISRTWHEIDAEGQVLGRLATRIARMLMGKDRANFSRSVEMADFVVVVNAEKIKVTGRKDEQKVYYRHTGYPGGIKQRTLAEMREKFPERIITHAVRGMLPNNKLRDTMLSRLKVYSGPSHPHSAQKPTKIETK